MGHCEGYIFPPQKYLTETLGGFIQIQNSKSTYSLWLLNAFSNCFSTKVEEQINKCNENNKTNETKKTINQIIENKETKNIKETDRKENETTNKLKVIKEEKDLFNKVIKSDNKWNEIFDYDLEKVIRNVKEKIERKLIKMEKMKEKNLSFSSINSSEENENKKDFKKGFKKGLRDLSGSSDSTDEFVELKDKFFSFI